MASVLVQFRVDSELKDEVSKICRSIGLDLNSAIKIYLNRMVQEKGLPFDMKAYENSRVSSGHAVYDTAEGFARLLYENKRKEKQPDEDMSLDEINQIIFEARRDREIEQLAVKRAREAEKSIREKQEQFGSVTLEEINAEIAAVRGQNE